MLQNTENCDQQLPERIRHAEDVIFIAKILNCNNVLFLLSCNYKSNTFGLIITQYFDQNYSQTRTQTDIAVTSEL